MEGQWKYHSIRKILMIISFIGFSFSSYLLYENQLWGNESLLFFISLWLFIIALFYKRFSKLKSAYYYILLSTLSGVILSVGFPPVGISPFLFLGFVPLFWIERKISRDYEELNKKEVFKYVFNAMLVWNILTTYWVANSSLFAGFFAIIVNSLLMTIPWVLFHVMKNKIPNLALWGFVCFWLSFEFLHFRWDLSWPWLTLGNGFSSFHSWIQWYEFTGVLGGSLWILWINIIVFSIIEKIISGEKVRGGVPKLLSFLLIPVIFVSILLVY